MKKLLALHILILSLLGCQSAKYKESLGCLANIQQSKIVVSENPLIKNSSLISFTENLNARLSDCGSTVLFKPMLEYDLKKARILYSEEATDELVMRDELGIRYLLKVELMDAQTGMFYNSLSNYEEDNYPHLQDNAEDQVKMAFTLIDLNTNSTRYFFNISARSIPLAIPPESSNSNYQSVQQDGALELNEYINPATLRGTFYAAFSKAAKKMVQKCACNN